MISFPSLTSLCVSLFKFNFLGTCWSDSSHFCINTTTGPRSIIFKLWPPRIFFGELLAIKISNFGFFRGQTVYVCESRLYSKLRNANIFALIDETPFISAACSDSCCRKFFSGQFLSIKLEFLNFLGTDSTFSLALCVS